MTIVEGFALFASLGALVLALRSYLLAQQSFDTTLSIFHIIENRSSRTVVCDLQDGRITVIKELRDAT